MLTATLSSTAWALKDYYRILESGSDKYEDGAALRPLLGDHLDYRAPRRLPPRCH